MRLNSKFILINFFLNELTLLQAAENLWGDDAEQDVFNIGAATIKPQGLPGHPTDHIDKITDPVAVTNRSNGPLVIAIDPVAGSPNQAKVPVGKPVVTSKEEIKDKPTEGSPVPAQTSSSNPQDQKVKAQHLNELNDQDFAVTTILSTIVTAIIKTVPVTKPQPTTVTLEPSAAPFIDEGQGIWEKPVGGEDDVEHEFERTGEIPGSTITSSSATIRTSTDVTASPSTVTTTTSTETTSSILRSSTASSSSTTSAAQKSKGSSSPKLSTRTFTRTVGTITHTTGTKASSTSTPSSSSGSGFIFPPTPLPIEPPTEPDTPVTVPPVIPTPGSPSEQIPPPRPPPKEEQGVIEIPGDPYSPEYLENLKRIGMSAIMTAARGITYSFYMDNWQCKSPEQVANDWKKLEQFQIVRIYDTDCDSVALSLRNLRPHQRLFAGIFYLERLETSIEIIQQSITNEADGDWSKIDTLSIGNELVNFGKAKPADIEWALNKAREILRPKGYLGRIVSTDTLIAMKQHPELCGMSDYITANSHPYWDGNVGPQEAGPWLAAQMEELRQICGVGPNAEIVLAEAGWPSRGLTFGQLGIPSKDNQLIAVKSIVDVVGANTILFTTFNDYWKPDGSHGVEKFWGLLDD
ncbi:hypothetical protein WICPIJ_003902 [Wickerhamomyces pijperi]|uniref:Uncharacterized protein n=1 Tax=Wickerhamomyces pijperi TaxID=599730 RepID=A0A9P8Q8Z3_WICPI|nr:hypothetical protein WICPIJ_003902 [Wickerhamomyces pijperi]